MHIQYDLSLQEEAPAVSKEESLIPVEEQTCEKSVRSKDQKIFKKEQSTSGVDIVV